jgi:hypothetical protein
MKVMNLFTYIAVREIWNANRGKNSFSFLFDQTFSFRKRKSLVGSTEITLTLKRLLHLICPRGIKDKLRK